MQADGIGFDYGNTLVMDPFDMVMKMKSIDFMRIMENNGYEVSAKRFVNVWEDINMNVNYPFCSHFSQEIPLIKIFLEKLGVRKQDRHRISQQLLVAYRSGLKYVLKNDQALARTKYVLSELRKRGKKLFMLSNEKVDTLNAQLEWTGLARFFAKIIISKRLGIEKPDHRIFGYMIKSFDLPKERIVYVGDDPMRDIKPAKELGIKAILIERPKEMSSCWKSYNYELKDNEKPDFVIKDISELLQIIE